MNRFLTRRKGQDDDGGKKKKGKKGQVEPKPEFNISTALPKAEDFRTSLIMPGLSTRFSMLREQDDPNSKLGKASDDSVLQPKRQSRLHEFGFVPGGLSDIAEVSSLNGSIRPPFANERHGSFDSTRDDDGAGGIMSRARPGEGNVLFGGRQKIYKIPNAATSKGGLGRALYEDDVNLSTFQKLRQEEKEQRRKELEAAAADEQDGQHSEPSSPTTISQRRETSSSTNSGTLNTRTSTAATSIASQGANSIPVSSPGFPIMGAPTSPTELTRSTTKGRRLYDQGLDQHIHEQQSSAMNRLNSLQRSRAPTGRSTPPLLFSQTKSATNLNDRFTRGIALRTESPTPQGYPGGSTGKEPQSAGSSPVIPYPHSPPLASPLASDSEEAQTLHAAIKPHDRGKATAMGAFNKPKQAFNEQQYAERLKRMQQERDIPSSRPESPRKLSSDVHRKPSLEKDAPSKVSLENPRKPSSENPRKMTLRERAEMEKRRRAEAAEAGRQRSESFATDHKEAPSAFSVFQAAANRMKDQGPPSPAPVTKLPSPPIQRVQSPEERAATFLTSPNSSDDEEEAYPKNTIQKTTDIRSRIENIPVATGPAPPIFEHPALRSQNSSAEELEQQHPALRPQVNEPTPRPDSETNVPDADVDSPTLGPNNGGLSGLIRQHLRSISNVSSNYGEDQPLTSPPVVTPVGLGLQTQNLGLQRRQPASEADTPAPSSYSHSNPWDLDDIDNPYRDERDSVSSVSPVENHKLNPQTLHGAIKEPNEWEPEVKKAHTREPSAESHDEHEAFQRDLAQRQRIIQESLRAKAEGRSTSPAPGGLKTALSMLRAKSSRESFATVDRQHDRQLDHSMKAMKMLGISAGNSTNASTASLATPGSDHAPPLRQKPSRVLQQSEQDAQREMANRQRSATNDSNNRDARLKGRSPPTSTRSSTRDRSSSEASSGGGRSRSRHRAYRDDLEQAMAEGTNRSTIYPANIPSPSIPGYVVNPTQPLSAERPSIDSQNQSQGRLRSRSNSRTTAANYFESKHLQPIHTGNASAHGQSPRLAPSPNIPTPQFSPGLPASPRPSPSNPSPNVNAFRPQGSPIPPFSANHTPPVSNPATPVAPGFSSPRPEFQPINKTGTLRKKSIAKSDISEPVFLSTTSVIDTVNLPPGASLKNGIDAAPPPVPPINPMRRRFGFGRSDQNQDGNGLDAPRAPYADPPRTNSSDNLSSQASTPRQRLRKSSSEGKSLHGRAQAQTGANPPMPSAAVPLGRNNSPPRPINQQHYTQQPMNGAMF